MNTPIISLGSTCEVADNLGNIGMRLEGCPFNYITTIDSTGFLKIIEDV